MELTSPTENDLSILPQMIEAWKQNEEEVKKLKEQMREKNTRKKALQDVILRAMKKHNIGALDLKKSNSRLLYKKKQTKAGLTTKSIAEYLTEHMKSEQDAKKAVEFIEKKRGEHVKTLETLSFEQL